MEVMLNLSPLMEGARRMFIAKVRGTFIDPFTLVHVVYRSERTICGIFLQYSEERLNAQWREMKRQMLVLQTGESGRRGD